MAAARDRKIAVFASTGRTGRHVVEELRKLEGTTAVAIGRNKEKLESLFGDKEGVEIRVADLMDIEAVRNAMDGCEAVLSTSGAVIGDMHTDIYPSTARNITTAMKEKGIKRLVYMGTTGVFVEGDRPPTSLWCLVGCLKTVGMLCCLSADGTYTLDVIDDNGCVAQTQSVQLFTSSVTFSSLVESSCGNLDLTASSTCSPLSFSWTTSDGSGLNPTSEDQTGLGPGTYDVVITDPNGCTNSASFTVGYGITNVFTNDVFYMYIPREIQWSNFVTGTLGTVSLVCPNSTTVVFNGDISRTTTATLTPFGILPEDNCTLEIRGSANPTGCSIVVGPVHVCANTGVGGPHC